MQNFLYQHSCYVMHTLFCSTKQKNVLQKDPLSISWIKETGFGLLLLA